MRIMMVDCPSCGSRHEWNVQEPDERCPRCKVMAGGDVTAMLIELRKGRVPGQEPILRAIENMHERIKKLEAKGVAVTDVK